MEHDDPPTGRPPSPQSKPMPAPTEAELSRVAREAVRQPPDPRLDKELARMGLMDTSEPAQPAEPLPTQPTDLSVVIDPELERLRGQQRRLTMILWMLVAVIAILAVAVLVLLFR